MITVMTKARKLYGRVQPSVATEYEIDFKNGVLRLFKNGVAGTTFQVGDTAEYDSYNLRYTGEIVKITENTVTVVKYKGHPGMEKTVRMHMHTFCWRNWDFDAAKVAAYNAEESMYI